MKKQSVMTYLPNEIKQTIRTLDVEKRRRCKVMLECGVSLKLEDVEHIRTLENETQLANFCRKLLFPC